MNSIWKIVLMPILFTGLISCAKFITAEDLGMNVFDAFQNNDVEHALDYIMYEEDYRDFFSSAELSKKEKDRLIKKHTSPSYIEERVERFKKRFVNILTQGKDVGIDWAYTKFEYIEGPKSQTHKGVQADEIYVFFTHETILYKLRLDDCYKCSRGWLMSDEPSFEGAISE